MAAPDTNWHSVSLVFNYQQQSTAMLIDGQSYLSAFAGTPNPQRGGQKWRPACVLRLLVFILGQKAPRLSIRLNLRIVKTLVFVCRGED